MSERGAHLEAVAEGEEIDGGGGGGGGRGGGIGRGHADREMGDPTEGTETGGEHREQRLSADGASPTHFLSNLPSLGFR